jgi:hypothetical protein
MKHYNQTEVILFSKYVLKGVDRKELVRWLGTTAQSAIQLQHVMTKKIHLRTLKDTPAIYMS